MTKLPKIKGAIFEAILPSTGNTFKYKAFSVREEKILLIAQESKDIKQAILAIRQIVNNCLIDLKIDDLTMFDLEYVLLLLRTKSVDNNISFSIKDKETQEIIPLELDLNNVKVVTPENHSKEIRIDDEYVLFMRYPSIDEFSLMLENGINDPETNYRIMISCMDKLVSKDSVFNFSEFTTEEIDDFAQDLSGEVVKKLKIFFETMPKLRHEIYYKTKTGKEGTFVLEGMETFFI